MTDVADYCRQLETYLCQRNGGHLVRIVGPAFDRVKGWAEQGVPLKIALRGVDRCCERYQAKGPRRRPVRIEFCEADILDLFDDWRRAVGVVAGAPEAASRKPGLASHIERVVQRLLALRTGDRSTAFVRRVDELVRSLEALLEPSRHARGSDRASIVGELSRLDRELIAAAASELDANAAAALRAEAEAELAPFYARMAPDARAAAAGAAFDRLVREAFALPVVVYS